MLNRQCCIYTGFIHSSHSRGFLPINSVIPALSSTACHRALQCFAFVSKVMLWRDTCSGMCSLSAQPASGNSLCNQASNDSCCPIISDNQNWKEALTRVLLVQALLLSGRWKEGYLILVAQRWWWAHVPATAPFTSKFLSNLSYIRGVLCAQLPEENQAQASFASLISPITGVLLRKEWFWKIGLSTIFEP